MSNAIVPIGTVLYYFQIIAHYLLNVANFKLPHLYFVEIFGNTVLESLSRAIVWLCLHDPRFSRYTIPGVTDTHTHTHTYTTTNTTYTVLE